jgi:hypothetical protein
MVGDGTMDIDLDHVEPIARGVPGGSSRSGAAMDVAQQEQIVRAGGIDVA